MSNEVGEKRLFGEMTVIQNNKGEVLVYVDKAKPEISSAVGPLEWWSSKGPVLNFPAGGRKTNAAGLQETFRETTERELNEETKEGQEKVEGEISGHIFLPRRNRNTGDPFIRQRTPFAVAQLGDDHINQIGVTSSLVDFDRFSPESKNLLQMRIDKNLAFWIKLNEIYQGLMDGDPQNAEFNGMKARPQMFTAALIWQLEKFGIKQLSDLIIVNGNRELIHRVKEKKTKSGLEIRNGSFQDNGMISGSLTARDRQFILGN